MGKYWAVHPNEMASPQLNARGVAIAGLLREQLLAEGRESEEIKFLFEKLLCDDIVDWLRQQQWDKVQQHVVNVLGWPADFVREILNKVTS